MKKDKTNAKNKVTVSKKVKKNNKQKQSIRTECQPEEDLNSVKVQSQHIAKKKSENDSGSQILVKSKAKMLKMKKTDSGEKLNPVKSKSRKDAERMEHVESVKVQMKNIKSKKKKTVETSRDEDDDDGDDDNDDAEADEALGEDHDIDDNDEDDFLDGDNNDDDDGGADDNASDGDDEDENADDVEDESDHQMKKPQAGEKHKQQMERLKETDPEFYKFLKEEDQELLDFDMSGSDYEDESEDEDDSIHRPPEELEVASDNDSNSERGSDVDMETSKQKDTTIVTLKMVARWRELMEEQHSVNALHESVIAFKAAVRQTGRDECEDAVKYRVEGSQVFNAIVTLCIREIPLTLQAVLGLKDNKKKKFVLPSSSKKWFRVKHNVKSYLIDLIQLLSQLADPNILSIILRHVHLMVPYYACFPKVAKHLIKKLVLLWSSAEESVRVLAFLSIFRIAFNLQDLLELCLKQLYMGYVRNCKFTSPSVLPMINFMQRSLTEMFAINTQVTYQHAFVYIRQLAIHLRNAITTKKKGNYQAIYNWQYIHSVYLWCRMLSTTHPNPTLKPLIYPLVQITIGVIKLIPAAKYYPLRFHCLRALNLLSEATGTFIPILPYVMEVFEQTQWNKRHTAVSFKPINFAVILKLSKSQLQERGFKDGLIDQLYDLILEHLKVHSHCIGFPELVLPLIIELKTFLKKCKVTNYCRQIKQLLEKIQENCDAINKRRDATTINLSDEKAITLWEIQSKQQGTPISKLYETYKKLREKELRHEEAGKERTADDKIPYIERNKNKADDKEEFRGLFMDTDDSDEDNLFSKSGRKDGKRKKDESDEESSDEEDESDDEESDEELEDDVKETKEKLGKKHHLDLKDVGEEEDIVEELQLSSSEDENDIDDEEEEDDDDDDDDDDDEDDDDD